MTARNYELRHFVCRLNELVAENQRAHEADPSVPLRSRKELYEAFRASDEGAVLAVGAGYVRAEDMI